MSGGLFGKTSFYSETQDLNIKESLKEGAGYGLLKYETEPNYEATKNINDKYGYLLQPTFIVNEKPLIGATINDFSRTADPTYGLNASYFNNLIGKIDEFSYGRELFIPPSYPNHYYNTQINSSAYLGLMGDRYPIKP